MMKQEQWFALRWEWLPKVSQVGNPFEIAPSKMVGFSSLECHIAVIGLEAISSCMRLGLFATPSNDQ
jgi:hypothetical protein